MKSREKRSALPENRAHAQPTRNTSTLPTSHAAVNVHEAWVTWAIGLADRVHTLTADVAFWLEAERARLIRAREIQGHL